MPENIFDNHNDIKKIGNKLSGYGREQLRIDFWLDSIYKVQTISSDPNAYFN